MIDFTYMYMYMYIYMYMCMYMCIHTNRRIVVRDSHRRGIRKQSFWKNWKNCMYEINEKIKNQFLLYPYRA